MTSTTVPAKRVFPIAGVFDDVVVSRKGALTLGWELTFPTMYSSVEDDYDEIIDALAAAIRTLPAWSVVHRQEMYLYKDYDPRAAGGSREPFLAEAYGRHFDGRKYLVHRSFLFVTIAARPVTDKNGNASGLFGIGGTVNVPSVAALDTFRSKCSEFLSVLGTGGHVSARPLRERDYLGEGDDVGIIQQYMMLGNDSPVMSDIMLAPDSVSVYDQSLQAYVICESDQLPSELATVDSVPALSSSANTVWLSFAAKIGCLLECNHVVNQYIVVPNQDEIKRTLDAERKKMNSGIKSVDNRINGAEIGDFLEAAYRSGLFTVKTHVDVLAWGPEADRLRISGLLSSAIKSMNNISAVYNNYNTPVLWYAGIPTNGFEIGRENLMTMELMSSLCLMPYETYEKGIPGGPIHLCDRTRHVPLDVDIQKRAQKMGLISNYNIFILGASGSGKSFFTNKLCRDLYDAGQAVFIIDVGDSYEGLASVIHEESGGRDGVYLSWDDDHPLTFNAMAGAETWLCDDGSLRADEEGGNFFFTLVQAIYQPDETSASGGWTSQRKTVLQKTITDYLYHCRATGETPLFDNYYQWFDNEVLPKMTFVSEWEKAKPDLDDEDSSDRLAALKRDDYKAHGYWAGENLRVTTDLFDAKGFALALKEYSKSGTRGRLLNDPAPKDVFSSDFTVIEVDRLSKDDMKFYSVCILCIMHALDEKMRKDTDKFKTFIIEEAWAAISNETMAPFLRGLWKTARKYNTAACVVTQEVGDIIDNPIIKTAIIDNSQVKILLDQSNHLNVFGPLQKVLSLTDKDKDTVLSVGRGIDESVGHYKEVYINLGGKWSAVFGTEVSREEALAYESNKTDKEPVLRRAAELGSYIEAIREFAKKK